MNAIEIMIANAGAEKEFRAALTAAPLRPHALRSRLARHASAEISLGLRHSLETWQMAAGHELAENLQACLAAYEEEGRPACLAYAAQCAREELAARGLPAC